MGHILLVLLLLLAFPGAAGASTAAVEPFVESPEVDPFGSCSRYMMCPPDMLVFRAAAGESNQLSITIGESLAYQRIRFVVRDDAERVEAGAGCEQIDPFAAACTAGIIGPVQLGDGDDRIAAPHGDVSGGAGADVLHLYTGFMHGDGGDDVVIGSTGEGDAGDDLLLVNDGQAGAGDDVLRCLRRDRLCHLDGGRGDDLLTGGATADRIFGRAGDDVLRGLAGNDTLAGGRGADRLDCGEGRGDRATADRHDRTTRCERAS